MNTKRWLVLLLFLTIIVFLITACQEDTTLQQDGFPLVEHWAFNVKNKVVEISASGSDVIFARTSQALYALTSDGGELLWEFPLEKQVITFPAIAFSERVYIADSKNLYALDIFTGELIWQQSLTEADGGRIVAVSNDVIVVNQPSYDLRVYNVTNGQFLWHTSTSRGITPAYIVDNTLIVPDYGVKTFDIWTGALLNQTDTNVNGACSFTNGILFYSPQGTTIHALQVSDNRELWSTNIEADGFIYCFISTEYVFVSNASYLYRLDKDTGVILWQKSVSRATKPTVFDNVLFFKEEFEGVIRAVSLTDGQDIGYLRIFPSKFFITTSDDLIASNKLLIFNSSKGIVGYSALTQK